MPKAERANLLLEQLWQQVVEDFERVRQWKLDFLDRGETLLRSPEDPTPLSRDDIASQPPHWTDETRLIAEAARKGATHMIVPRDTGEIEPDYAERLAELGQRFRGFTFGPADEDREAMQAGQKLHRQQIQTLQSQIHTSAQVTKAKLPSTSGATLYQAIEAYAARACKQNNGGGGKKEAEHALRFRNAITDMDLGSFGCSAIERIRDYWAARPIARLRGGKSMSRPISLTAAQLVRNAADGEVAGVFLSHGKPVPSDLLADVYSNRPFDKVAVALKKVHRQLTSAGHGLFTIDPRQEGEAAVGEASRACQSSECREPVGRLATEHAFFVSHSVLRP